MENQELKNILLLKSEELDDQQLKQINEIGFNPVILQLLNFEYNEYQQNVEQAISHLAQYDGRYALASLKIKNIFYKIRYSFQQCQFCQSISFSFEAQKN
ncbi:uroporphyrinogen-III synthase family protein, putative (macronuclear) [Tetrahymena thermophila SB210]|uniref:Uroporphyrinogen-III synthase family protein, putative n=1 Tax=Tetrahymena thermophila (strain SB210) TaxID=312017 RepID=Q22CG3_TETTS|nr:uroporphyrinogen-III synthase family protein, putative [Tetrahymena thermophila SB210]EAR82966.2 uroporphyrinogen-III synthase family protein, putative [Tetrahymena thermophila SB210]|eukprot:XP_001030629.2 uroporphyrinogen-III synthase family protein, putative [Tetrahymena thermophila SB210]